MCHGLQLTAGEKGEWEGGETREKNLFVTPIFGFLPSFLSFLRSRGSARDVHSHTSSSNGRGVNYRRYTHTQHSKENTYAMRGTLPPSYFGAATCTQLNPEECISGPQGLARASPSRARRYVSAFFFFLSFFSLCVCV